jgi:hypothetical protein
VRRRLGRRVLRQRCLRRFHIRKAVCLTIATPFQCD